MQPASPVMPGYQVRETVFTSTDPEVLPLPAVLTDDGHILTRWKLSAEDRQRIVAGQDVYVWVQTHGDPMQPISVEIITPEEIINACNPEENVETAVEEEWPSEIEIR